MCLDGGGLWGTVYKVHEVQETMAQHQRFCRLQTHLGLQIFSMLCGEGTTKASMMQKTR